MPSNYKHSGGRLLSRQPFSPATASNQYQSIGNNNVGEIFSVTFLGNHLEHYGSNLLGRVVLMVCGSNGILGLKFQDIVQSHEPMHKRIYRKPYP